MKDNEEVQMDKLQEKIQQLSDLTTDQHIGSMENIGMIEEVLSIILRGKAPQEEEYK